MKKHVILFGLAILSTISFMSCGGKKEEEKKAADYTLEVDKVLSGPMSEAFEVTKAVLKISGEIMGSKLMVEVKRTDKALPFDEKDQNVCGVGVATSSEWCISAEIIGENDIPVESNLEKYGYEPFEKLPSMKAGETVWLEFSIRESEKDPSKAKKVKLTSSIEKRDIQASTGSDDASSESSFSGDCDQFISDYESFVNDYVSLMKKYKANPTDASLLSEYSSMVSKAADMQKNATSCTDPKYAAKLAKLAAKVAEASSGLQ
jgi:hypothetical protein